jgi:hypothetical protein
MLANLTGRINSTEEGFARAVGRFLEVAEWVGREGTIEEISAGWILAGKGEESF